MTKIDLNSDKAIILSLGGATRVADLLGLGPGGAQRVHNWLTRGIPARVKLQRPDLFLRRNEYGEAPSHPQRRSTDEACA